MLGQSQAVTPVTLARCLQVPANAIIVSSAFSLCLQSSRACSTTIGPSLRSRGNRTIGSPDVRRECDDTIFHTRQLWSAVVGCVLDRPNSKSTGGNPVRVRLSPRALRF
jgi:hypothetical protein